VVRCKILLIDNDPALLGLLALELELAGHRVQSHASAEEALRCLPDSADLAIVDYRLPGMDGLTLLRQLRYAYPGLPALIISSDCRPEAMPSGRAVPPTHLLRKPFFYDSFMESVRDLLPARSRV
jgi:CheY-like chemotaxis protein